VTVAAGDAALVREMYELFNAGEYQRSTGMLHPEVVLHQWQEVPDTDVYVGREGFVRGISRWLAGFEPGFQFQVGEVTEVGDRVLMQIALSGRGRGSGLELERSVFHVWELRDGMGYRCRVYSSEEEARRAALEPG
jgi:ketosteroid isomerase-like protein